MGLRMKYSKKDYKHELDATHAKSIKSNKVMWPKRREILIGASKRTGRLGVAPHGVTHTMWTVFDLILPNALMEKVPGSWRYLRSHLTMLGFLCIWSWQWYVSGVVWKKEHGMVWRTYLAWTLVSRSCLICGVPLDGLVCVNKNCAHISQKKCTKIEVWEDIWGNTQR